MKKSIIIVSSLCLMLGCKSNSISDPEKQRIIAELDHIYKMDQEHSGIPSQELLDEFGATKAWEIYQEKGDSIRLINQRKIKSLYKRYGYLSYDEIGESVSRKFWISIQHADNDVAFQQEMLSALKKEVEKGNADKSDYAMLEDRVNVNLDMKQRFGTQITYNKLGQAIQRNGLVDSTNIEKIRAEYGLPSFKEYYYNMTRSHYEMNNKNYIKSGITEPQLYK